MMSAHHHETDDTEGNNGRAADQRQTPRAGAPCPAEHPPKHKSLVDCGHGY